MNNLTRLTFLILIFSLISISAQAQKKRKKKERNQSTTEQVEVKLNNGNILVGKLIKYSQDSVVIQNEEFGRIAFAQTEVKTYKGLDGKALDEDVELGYDKSIYQSQYILSPSARPVGEGNRYYTNFGIFVNTFSFGVTDNFSFSFGFESVSLFVFGRLPIMNINPKLSLPISDAAYVGLGTVVFVATNVGRGEVGGISYANITLGSGTQNFTFGVGYAFAFGEVLNEPLFQLGFAYPLSRKVSVIAEGFFTSEVDGGYNLGLRIITRSNIAFDVGISRITDTGSNFLGLPLLSFSIPL